MLTRRERLEFRVARALAALPPRYQLRISRKPPVRIDGGTLDPEIQMTLALLERRGDPPIETLPPPRARAAIRHQAEVFTGPPVPVGPVRDFTIPGPGGPLPVRHYAPDEAGGPHPLIVFLHGGGFVVGDLETHDGPCRLLCRHAGAHVLAVDYRLAPEHPFPAAVEDASAALAWGLEHAAALGADPRRVGIAGDSAGGNLAAVATHLAVREGRPAPHLQLLLYPTTDSSTERPSLDLFAEGFFLTKPQIEWFALQYAGGDPDAPNDPRISLLLADDLSGLPPAYVVTCGFDPLRDQGEAYAAALREAGVPVALRRFSGQIHGFINAVGVSRVSREQLVEVAGATRAMLGPAVVREPA